MVDTTYCIVCGGRHFDDEELLTKTLDKYYKKKGNGHLKIVSGHASGADVLAEHWAKMHAVPLIVIPADWNKYGRAAGPIRNREMLGFIIRESKNPEIIAFWDGKSRGTKNMISQGEKVGVNVRKVMY